MTIARDPKPTIFLSNQLELLAKLLKQRLFQNQVFNHVGDLFTPKNVIVPNEMVKNFLLRFFADDPELKIAAGIRFYSLAKYLREKAEDRFPSSQELSLRIQWEMGKGSEVLWDNLSGVFQKYREYGKNARDAWEEKGGWQQDLWKKLGLDQLSEKKIRIKGVHLFGFSFLPRDMIFEESYFYFLSPSEMYLGDYFSSKEQIQLEKRAANSNEDHELYLENPHPLLANFGKIGKENQKYFDECPATEFYEPISSETLLGRVQNDLLSGGVEDFSSTDLDGSIQIDSAPTRLREIEILHQTIRRYLAEDEKFSAGDIAVYVRGLEDYLPYIQWVFGSEEACADYIIADLSAEFEGLWRLFSIVEERFSAGAVLKLFESTSFQKKQGWKQEQIEIIEKWIGQGRILWGFNQEQAKRLLGEEQPSGFPCSWSEGFNRLLDRLPLLDEETLSLTEAELFGEAIFLLEKISADFKSVINDEKKTLIEWSQFLHQTFKNYFSFDLDFFAPWQNLVLALRDKSEEKISFKQVEKIWKSLAKTVSSGYQNSALDAVHFYELKPDGVVPSRVICLVGMDEDSFPRKETISSLDEIKKMGNSQFFPNQKEQDHWLFLSLIVSARSKLYMSYLSFDKEEGYPIGPSFLIGDLIAYIEKKFGALLTITNHPSFSFDSSYFQHPSYCNRSHFCLAEARTRSNKELFIPEFWNRQGVALPETCNQSFLSISLLKKIAKNGLAAYFNEKLQIVFERKSNLSNEFYVDPLEKYFLKRRAIETSWDKALQYKIENSPFSGVAIEKAFLDKMEEDVSASCRRLIERGLDPSQFQTILFHLAAKEKIQKSDSLWIYPSPEVVFENGEKIKITGKLEGVTPKGLYYWGKGGDKERIRAWPSYLLYRLTFPEAPSALHFSEEEEIWDRPGLNPLEQLKKLIRFAFLCLQSPSPHDYHWTRRICKRDFEGLAKELKGSEDPYWSWLISRDGLPSPEILIENWASVLEEVFHEVF